MTRTQRLAGAFSALVVAACGGGGGGGGGGGTTHALTLSHAGSGGGTVTSAPAGLSCASGTCTASFADGASVTLTAAPAGGSTFAGWGGACSGTATTCTVAMTADQSVTATFQAAAVTRTLSVAVAGTGAGSVASSPAGLSCASGTCSASFADGASVTLTAAPAGGSTFAGWGGACSGTATTCTVTMTADQSVTATFQASAVTRTLSVAVTGNGMSLVTSDVGGLSCGYGTCTATYADGATVTLTASPDASSAFTGWGGDCASAGTAATCTLTMSADRSVTAAFAPLQTLTVSVTSGGGAVTSSPGAIDCPTGPCTAAYPGGTAVTLTAVPAAGYALSSWGGDCSGTGPCVVTMYAARYVTATFVQRYDVAVTLSGTGAGAVTSAPSGIDCPAGACTAAFDAGTSVTLTATAASGSLFTGWTGDCASAGTGTCTLTASAARAVGATFALARDLTVTVAGSGNVASSPPGIDCWGPSCSAAFADGTAVTLTATASGGNQFTGWTGACSGTGATCAVTLSAATTVGATFTPIRTLTVSVPNGGGTLTSSPAGISCTQAGGSCSATWLDGSAVTLTIAPDAGWAVSWWSGGGCTGTGTSCAVTLTADTSVSVGLEGPFDFSLSTPYAGGLPMSLLPGESRSLPVSISTTRGAGLPVTLAVTGLPPGVTASFAPAAPTAPATSSAPAVVSTLTLTAASGAAPTQPSALPVLTVTGTSGAVSHPTTLPLEVRDPRGLSGSPYGVAIEPGGATALVTEAVSGWGVGRVVRVDLASRLAVKTVAASVQGAPPDLALPRDLFVESSGATALAVDSYGLVRVTLATGALARIPTTPALVDAHGIARVDDATVLVSDCGDSTCQNSRLVRVDLGSGAATQVTPAVSNIVNARGVALEADGLHALLVERGVTSGRLLRVTLSSGAVTTVATGLNSPSGLSLEAGGATALVSEMGGTVTRVALANGNRTQMMYVQSYEAPGIAVESGGGTALVVEDQPGRLVRLRLTNPIAFAAPSLSSFYGLARTTGIALTASGTALVTDCGSSNACPTDGRLVEADLATGRVLRQIATGLVDPRGVAIEPGGATALVVEITGTYYGTGRLDRIDLASGSVVATFGLGAYWNVRSVAVSGAVAYVTAQDNAWPNGAALLRVDLSTGAVSSVGGGSSGCMANGVALEPVASPTYALVARRCTSAGDLSDVVKVDLGTGATTGLTAPFPTLYGVAIEPGGTTALVTEGVDSSESGRLLRVDVVSGLATPVQELGAPLPAPRDLAILPSGDAVVAANLGLWTASHAPAVPLSLAVAGLDRPAGFALEAGETTGLVLSCGGADCTASGLLERVTLATPYTGRTAIATTLNSPAGVAAEAANKVLVSDCGPLPLDCTTKGRVVEFTGTTPTAQWGGLNQPGLLAMQPDGVHALVVERGTGRILQLDLQNPPSFVPVASGLNYPVQVLPEANGTTALLTQTGIAGLYRVDLASGATSLVAPLYEAGKFALEPGGATALLLGAGWPVERRAVLRVNVTTAALDVLVPGVAGDVQAADYGATTGLWYAEQPAAGSSYRGAVVHLASP